MAEIALQKLRQRFSNTTPLTSSSAESAMRSLELVRIAVQSAFDKEVDEMIKHFIEVCTYFVLVSAIYIHKYIVHTYESKLYTKHARKIFCFHIFNENVLLTKIQKQQIQYSTVNYLAENANVFG